MGFITIDRKKISRVLFTWFGAVMPLLGGGFFIFTLEAEAVRSLSYIQVIDSLRNGRVIESNIWLDRDHLRMEYVDKGLVTVMMVKEGELYTYWPSQEFAVIQDLPENFFSSDVLEPEILLSAERLKDYLTLVQAQVVGEESVLGHACSIYQFSDQSKVIHLWVDIQSFVPVQARLKIPGDILTIQYKNMVINPDMKSSLFELPVGIAIKKVSNAEEMSGAH